MPGRPTPRVSFTPLALAAMAVLALPTPTAALGLGEIEVRSRLNQPFAAVIPLTGVAAGELRSISVHLAGNDEYERRGVEREDAAGALAFIVERGRQPRVVVSSQRLVKEPILRFLVEAQSNEGRVVREYTALLDPPASAVAGPLNPSVVVVAPATATASGPDPDIPPPAPIIAAGGTSYPGSSYATAQAWPRPSVAPDDGFYRLPRTPAPRRGIRGHGGHHAVPPPVAPEPAQASAAAAGVYGPVRDETLWRVANAVRPDAEVSINQVLLSLWRANRSSFHNGDFRGLERGATLAVPTRSAMLAIPAGRARLLVAALNAGHHPPVGQLDVPRSGPSIGRGEAPASPAPVTGGRLGESVVPADAIRQATPPPAKPTIKPEAVSAPASRPPAAGPGPGTTVAAPVSATTSGAPSAATPVAAPSTVPTAPPVAPVVTPAKPVLARPSHPAPVAPPPTMTQDEGPGLMLPLLAILGVLGLGAVLVSRRRRPVGGVAGIGGAVAPPAPTAPGGWWRSRLGRKAGVAGQQAPVPVAPAGGRPAPVQDITPGTVSAPIVRRPNPQDTSRRVPPPAGVPVAAAAATAVMAAGEGDRSTNSTNVVPLGDDPLAEADFHLAYGLYDEAIALLKQAVEAAPGRVDYRVKLAETYFSAGRAAEYAATVEALKGQVPADTWDRLLVLGRQLSPEAPVFRDATPGPGTDVDLDFTAPDPRAGTAPVSPFQAFAPDPLPEADRRFTSLADSLTRQLDAASMTATIPTPDRLPAPPAPAPAALPFTLQKPATPAPGESPGPKPTAPPPAARPEAPLTLAPLEPPSGPVAIPEPSALDADPFASLAQSMADTGQAAPIFDSPLLPAKGPGEGLTAAPPATAAAPQPSAVASPVLGPNLLSAELGTGNFVTTAVMDEVPGAGAPAGPVPVPPMAPVQAPTPATRFEDLHLAPGPLETLDINEASAAMRRRDRASAGEATVPDPFDIRLEDLDVSLTPRALDTGTGGDEASTKLELARAYAEMGDNDMARTLLEEVRLQGSMNQQAEARTMLDRLPVL